MTRIPIFRLSCLVELHLVVANAALADAIHLCREGAVPVITIGDVTSFQTQIPDTISLDQLRRNHRLNRQLKPALNKYTGNRKWY